jgi:hypothetical protein
VVRMPGFWVVVAAGIAAGLLIRALPGRKA